MSALAPDGRVLEMGSWPAELNLMALASGCIW